MIPGPCIIGRLLKAEGTETLAIVPYFAFAAFGLLPAAVIAEFTRDTEKRTLGSQGSVAA
jgi:hypothetical protein